MTEATGKPADPAAHEERVRWVLDRVPDSDAVTVAEDDVRAVLGALDAARADVERLRGRTHEIQAQEMTKRAALDSELAEWRTRYEAAETERDEARAEVERLRGLWPTNGLGEETNVHQLVANHRAWTRQAWKARDEALAERTAERARASEMEQRYDRLALDVQRLAAEKAEAWAAGERLAARIDAALAAVDALAADANGWAPEPAAAMDEHAAAIRKALGEEPDA